MEIEGSQKRSIMGCISSFKPPFTKEDEYKSRTMMRLIKQYNEDKDSTMKVKFREHLSDIQQPVYHWDFRGPSDIFRSGFMPRKMYKGREADYYNLRDFVTKSDPPLKKKREPYIYISTSSDPKFKPKNHFGDTLFKYCIHTPGGIIVNETIIDKEDKYSKQMVIAFAGGIYRAYIKSVVRYNSQRFITLPLKDEEEFNLKYFKYEGKSNKRRSK